MKVNNTITQVQQAELNSATQAKNEPEHRLPQANLADDNVLLSVNSRSLLDAEQHIEVELGGRGQRPPLESSVTLESGLSLSTLENGRGQKPPQ